MSPTSCRCSTPRQRRGRKGREEEDEKKGWGAKRGCRARGPHFPGSCPPSTSPALAGGTTGFGMGPGGAPPRSLTPGTPAVTTNPAYSEHQKKKKARSKPKAAHRPMATWATPTLCGYNRPRPCAPLRSNGCPLSTRGRSTRWSAGGLTCSKAGAIGHLPVGFPLRCAQRFSHPDVATRRCCFGNNRHTSGRSSPVLSY